MMKNRILLTACAIFVCLLSSCEEEDSPLLFSVDNVSNQENVKMEYYSPDPCCVSKMYWIEANSCASELTIKCTNASAVLIEGYEGKTSEEYASNGGLWKAEIINSATIKFTFEEIDNSSIYEYYSSCVGFNVVAQTKKGVVRAYFDVRRLTKSANPI